MISTKSHRGLPPVSHLFFLLIAGFWGSIVLIDLRDFQEFPLHPTDIADNVTFQFRHVVRSESPISERDFLLSLRFKLRSRDPITLQSEVCSFLSLHDSKSIWTTTRVFPSRESRLFFRNGMTSIDETPLSYRAL
jgi:hypothetical protein